MSIANELKKAQSIWMKLFPRGFQIPNVKGPNTNLRNASDVCSDHWSNTVIFGKCWKHNPDGTLKRLFVNPSNS